MLVQRVADAAWIALAHLVAFWVYEGHGWSFVRWEAHDTVATGGAILGFLFAAEAGGLYQAWRGVPLHDELMRVLVTWGAVVLGLLSIAFMFKQSATFSRVITIAWFLSTPLLIGVWRTVVRKVLHEARRRGRNTRRVAIVGATEIGEQVARRIAHTPALGMRLVGFFDDRAEDRCHAIDPALTAERADRLTGDLADVVAAARYGDIDLIYVALPLRAVPRVQALLAELADTTASVYMVPDFQVFDLLQGRWSSLDDIPVVSVFETPFYGIDGWLKRAEDIVLGAVFLTLAAIPMLVIASFLKLSGAGPVFFRQRRYGLNGEVIDVLKFRTMTVAEDADRVVQATRDDRRVTKLGAILRRTSLDELPQLLHVVGGSMSLVGPRPHAVAHNEEYRTRIRGYMLRHKVKPGLTGWAQVNGWRGATDTLEKMEKRVEHDLEYIRRWGLWLDLKIIALTIFSRKVHQNAF